MRSAIMEKTGMRQRKKPPIVKAAGNSADDGEKEDKITKEVEVEATVWRPPPLPERTSFDFWMEIALFVLAYCVRMYKLADPKAVVFDEYHFGKFVNWTLLRQYYFDIHPPLGKLVLAGWGHLVGYEPVEGFMYDNIGKGMGETQFYPLREFSAFIGSFIPVIGYKTARLMGLDSSTSLVAGVCLAMDHLLVIESRLILLDAQLILCCVLCMYCALYLWRKTERGTPKRWLWLFITGVAAGLAISIKWTGLAYPGVVGIISFFGLYFPSEPLTLLECLFAGVTGIVTYAIPYYFHFKQCDHSGTGDNFMEPDFRHRLIGNAGYDPSIKPKSFLYNFIYLNKRMFISNKGISAEHNWASKWYQWIVNWRGILYYRDDPSQRGDLVQTVYLFANPVVAWLGLGAIGFYLISVLVLGRYRDSEFLAKHKDRWMQYAFLGSFCACSWLANLLPYILVDRSSFAYHYLPGLYYAELCIGLTVNLLPKKARSPTSVVIILLVAAAYVYWAPWVYATPIPETAHKSRRWLPRWD